MTPVYGRILSKIVDLRKCVYYMHNAFTEAFYRSNNGDAT